MARVSAPSRGVSSRRRSRMLSAAELRAGVGPALLGLFVASRGRLYGDRGADERPPPRPAAGRRVPLPPVRSALTRAAPPGYVKPRAAAGIGNPALLVGSFVA